MKMNYVCNVCGGPAETYSRICKACREKKADAEYKTLPAKIWDQKNPAYSDALDIWFFSMEDIENHWDDNGRSWTPERMRLHPSEPTKFSELSDDQWTDEISEYAEEVPDELSDIIDEFNKKLAKISTGYFAPDKRFRLTLREQSTTIDNR